MGYLRVLSAEEVRVHDQRVKALYRSRNLARNVAAVLMDTRVGDAGDTERVALTKAKAIEDLLRSRGLVR